MTPEEAAYRGRAALADAFDWTVTGLASLEPGPGRFVLTFHAVGADGLPVVDLDNPLVVVADDGSVEFLPVPPDVLEEALEAGDD